MMPDQTRKTVAIVGQGNIGSFAVELLAKNRSVGRIVAIDRDSYEARNIANQHIVAGETGFKAEVQAGRARAIRPDLDVEAVVADIEHVPLGALRSDLILGCLDSRRARQVLNERAWRLGIPYVDAGVNPDFGLARVTVYRPGSRNACLECLYTAGDYASVESEYPCGAYGQDAPTEATAELGSVAAALQAAEARKILDDPNADFGGRQMLFDLKRLAVYRSRLNYNPNCRFDHRTLLVEAIELDPAHLTLAELFEVGGGQEGGPERRLRVVGGMFANQAFCLGCRATTKGLFLEAAVREKRCPECGHSMRPLGWPRMETVFRHEVKAFLGCRLSDLGVRLRDVVEFGGGRVVELHSSAEHFLGGSNAPPLQEAV